MSQYSDPYGSPQSDFSHSKPKGSGMKIVLIILGVVGGLGVLGCGCCGGFMYFGVNQLTVAVKNGYGDHELVQEHIGNIESISTNFEATGETVGGLAFDIEGSKGDGQIIAYDQMNDQFGDAELHVNGEVYNLGPSR